MTRLTAIDLCAGAGGMSLGLMAAGFDVLGVEIDADAVESHRANVGPCERSEIECWRPPRGRRFDLVAGGVPCQSFSAAGAREGMRDPRGLLFRHLLRVAVECDASAVLLENVEGLVSWRDATGTTALRILDAAWREHGYTPISRVLCAADYGVPQARYRLFLVGFRDATHAAAFRWPEPTHGPPGNLLGLTPWVTVRQALKLGPGRFASGRIEGASGWNGQRMLDVDSPSPSIATRGNGELLRPIDRPALTVSAGGTKAGGAEAFPNAKYRRDLADDLAAAGLLDRPCTTIDARGALSVAGHHTTNKAGAVRVSIAQEAALQGFPPTFVFVGNKSAQHRQIGNACPPALAEHVSRAIRKALASSRSEAA